MVFWSSGDSLEKSQRKVSVWWSKVWSTYVCQGSYPMSNQQMPMQLESQNRCLQRRVCKIACVGFCSYLYPACTQSMYIHLTQMCSDVGNEWTKRMEWSRCAEMVPLHFSRQSYVWDLISLPALCQRKLQVFFISCVRNISILRCDNGLQAFASGSCIRLHFSHICLIYLVYEVYMVPGPNCWLKSTSTGAKQLPTGVPISCHVPRSTWERTTVFSASPQLHWELWPKRDLDNSLCHYMPLCWLYADFINFNLESSSELEG